VCPQPCRTISKPNRAAQVIAPSTTRRLLDHLGRGEPRQRDDDAVAVLTDRERDALGEIAQG
jgi:hypothetical protein